MAEKFLLNYLLPDNNDSVLSIMDISDWITSIENFMRSSNYQIFTIAIAGEKEYIESTIDENLIPEHIKAIKDRDFSYYDYPDDDLELLHFRRN